MISLKNIPHTRTEIQNHEDIENILPKLVPFLSPPLVIKQISGGITNRIFKVSHASDDGTAVLLRIFGGADVFTPEQRAKENEIFAQLARTEIAPALHAVFGNGRVEQFFDSRPITLDEMTTDVVCFGVAQAMARLHSFRPTGISDEVRVWDDIDAWSNEALKLSKKGLTAAQINVEKGLEWVEIVRARLEKRCSPVVYAHNDLLCGNILLSPQNEVRIVDFEYSSFNYRGFDIANFFSECMGGTIDGRVHPEKYPGLEFRTKFCETYLKERGASVSEEAVRDLVRESEDFELLTHLYWGFWALVQSTNSAVDFPYTMFAEGRFAEFLKRFKTNGIASNK
ncbi:Choline/ethanolamine kinase [Gracilaria domingensis]|nr:Choline/ethanolamine kinase [Gracilaria domingensis]